MEKTPERTSCLVIGGGVVGTAVAFTLARSGVDVVLVEKEKELGLAASGTNSGCLHTGFDSVPGELETQMILRSNELREEVLAGLNVPVLHCGAVLTPTSEEEHATVAALAENARENGVEVSVNEVDGALRIPGEWITDPVAYTTGLGRAAELYGARICTGAEVTGVDSTEDGFTARLRDGDAIHCDFIVNAAGLFADDVAQLVGGEDFAIYPRKGEFLVFQPEKSEDFNQILLPVPTKRTKGVLVFPTVDGAVIAGPTAVDLEDKLDWTVRDEAEQEILSKVSRHAPELASLQPVARYSGLRTAGVDSNYIIRPHVDHANWIQVAAIRSTGLSASLGIGEYVTELLAEAGLELGEMQPMVTVEPVASDQPWWRRTAEHVARSSA